MAGCRAGVTRVSAESRNLPISVKNSKAEKSSGLRLRVVFHQHLRLEDRIPGDHPFRSIDAVLKLDGIRTRLLDYYSRIGWPSIDPELMLRMLLIGYACGIRSERQLCREVDLNLAYRWFCRLGLEGAVPDASTFSKNRYGRFRESDIYRALFEDVVSQCRKAGLVPGEGFAVDGSFIQGDACRDFRVENLDQLRDAADLTSRPVREYLGSA